MPFLVTPGPRPRGGTRFWSALGHSRLGDWVGWAVPLRVRGLATAPLVAAGNPLLQAGVGGCSGDDPRGLRLGAGLRFTAFPVEGHRPLAPATRS